MSEELVLEKIEWVNFRWQEATNNDLPRVLLIGDSISNGYQRFVAEELSGQYNVDLMATSKGLDNPAILKEAEFAMAEFKHVAIHFNNGLHGWHLDDDQYERGLRVFVEKLQSLAPNAKLIWCDSTSVTVDKEPEKLCPEKTPMVLSRNERAAMVMKEFNIPINDLYNKSVNRPEWRSGDRAHYNETGQKAQGGFVAEAILELIGEK